MNLNQLATNKFTNLDSLSSKVDHFNFEELDVYLDFLPKSDCRDEFDILDIIKNIKVNFCGWVKSGLLLKCIKDNFKFVLQSRISKSWKDFCITHLHKSSWVCNNFIRSAEVVLILFKNGFNTLPSYESHARILAKFLPNLDQMSDAEIEDCEDRICELWNNVLSASAGKHLTVDLINSVVEPDKESNQKVLRISPKLYEKLLDQAIRNGYLSINEYLENLDSGDAIAPDENLTTQDQLQQWELDLADLIEPEPEPEVQPEPETPPKYDCGAIAIPLPEPETKPHCPTDNSHNPYASRVLDSVCMSPNVSNLNFLLEDES